MPIDCFIRPLRNPQAVESKSAAVFFAKRKMIFIEPYASIGLGGLDAEDLRIYLMEGLHSMPKANRRNSLDKRCFRDFSLLSQRGTRTMNQTT